MKQFFPKGRQIDAALVDDIKALLGPKAGQRDLLIEHLHTVQDHYGKLSKELIAALGDAMKLSQAQVFEVASFYAHFHIEDEKPTQKYCNSITCSLFGKGVGTGVPCVGRCDQAPVQISDTTDLPEYIPFEDYSYTTLAKVAGKRDFVLEQLESANLRGLGGAGFKVATKWQFFDPNRNDAILVVNADEGEPGTFKDRYCLSTNPHKMLEGMLIAADVINASDIYIYLRDEYADVREILLKELPKIKTDKTIHLRRGAGAYICGEETALLESLEGKRGLPRIKPPYPAQSGLFGHPTLVNNVETLWRVQDILEHGIERGYYRFYSISGRVQNPGVYEAPVNSDVSHLIDRAGGMAEGHVFKAYLPGGASGGILPAHLNALPLNFGALESLGCFVGSAALIILSDQDNIKDVVTNLMDFFNHESCGQCTPCRLGCEKLSIMLKDAPLDIDLAKELGAVMQSSSICGLGQAAPNPLISALAFFEEEFK